MNNILFLCDGKRNTQYIIVDILECDTKTKLIEFGFVCKNVIQIIQYSMFHKTMLIELGQSRVAIDCNLASKIMVKNNE